MKNEALTIVVPHWIDDILDASSHATTDDERMAFAVALARENVRHGGGPFGSVVYDGERFIAGGVNLVLATGYSIAHAEIVALMRAQQRLRFDVADPSVERNDANLTLYTSAEPCCQCFGAIVWSGVSRLVCAATRQDVEAIGFDEGPKPEQWIQRLEGRGISTTEGVLRQEASDVLGEYSRGGGRIYGRRV